MTINTLEDGTFGLASSATDTAYMGFLFSGTPPKGTKQEVYGSFAADVPAFSVVGRVTATGKLKLSDTAAVDGSQKAIGITTSFLAVQSPNADQPVNIWYNGTFNPASLNWHGSYSTAALKKLAFEDSAPQIVIKTISP